MSEFNDRFAVVTGASSGIGLKLTETLLGHGATVLAMARREGPPESLHAHSGKRLHWLAGDVTRERDLDALASRAASIGPVDYLVPNAGIAQLADGLDSLAFEQQWRVNGAGALNTFSVLSRQTSKPASVVFIGTFLSQRREESLMRCALVIPTRNAGAHLDRLLPALAAQRRQPDSILVVDSRSSDDTVERFRAFGARVEVIEPASFNHGGTRRWASQQVEADALIYLTQDAIPASPDSFANLLDELYAEADIGVAYGRQLPHPGAGLLGAQARRFNYPPESRSKRLADASELGIKTCFSSDSFSAYRSDALAAVGGFPEDVIGSEDAYVAARLLQAGYAVRYAASAEVYHSHDYRLLEEFRRYFDIGVFYGRERWIRAAFGGAGGEGKRYVLAEIQALRAAGALYRVPEIALRSAFKLLGYRLGQLERHLPVALKRRISMFPGYWK